MWSRFLTKIFDGSKKYEEKLTNGLMHAILDGRDGDVRLLIREGASVAGVGWNSDTPLTCAASRGLCEIVKILIEADCNTEQTDIDGNTSLMLATRYGHYEVVQTLVDYGCNVENSSGNTALIMATLHGFHHIAKILIYGGCDTEATDYQGNTSLLLAAVRADTNSLKLLIDSGCNMEHRNNLGDTALILSVCRGSVEVVKLLIESGANTEAIDSDGNTPLLLSASLRSHTILQLLIDSGCNLESMDTDGNTPLNIATGRSSSAAVKLLIEAGCNLDNPDANGNTACLIATYRRNGIILQYLLEAGCNVETMDHKKRTALWLLAESQDNKFRQQLGIILQLLLFDANSTGINNEYTLLYIIFEKLADIKIYLDASDLDLVDNVLTILIQQLENLDVRDNNGHTIVLKATFPRVQLYGGTSQHARWIEMLLEKGCSPNVCDKLGHTALYYTVLNKHRRATEVLLYHGANPNCYLDQPAIWRIGKDPPLMKLLLQFGCTLCNISSNWRVFEYYHELFIVKLLSSEKYVNGAIVVTDMLFRTGIHTNSQLSSLLHEPAMSDIWKMYPSTKSWIIQLLSEPMSLFSLARIATSNYLRINPKYTRNIDTLSIPNKLKSYLKYEDL